MGGYPALAIRPPDIAGPILEAQQIRAGQQQQQIRGQELQSGAINLQMQQLALKNMQITQSALSEPNLEQQFQDYQKSKGTAPTGIAAGEQGITGELHPMAQFLAEKKGLPYMGPGGALEVSDSFNKAAQETANLLKTGGEVKEKQLANYGKQIDFMADDVAPILAEPDKAKQDSALAAFKAKVQFQPGKYPPDLVQNLDEINTVHDLAQFSNSSKIHKEVIDLGTKLSEQQTAQANALLKTQAAAGIREKDGTFTPEARAAIDTIKTYTAMPPNVRNAFTTEMENAHNVETLQKTQARADDAEKSFQRSRDAFNQADAMRQSAVGQAMTRDLIPEDKAWSAGIDQTHALRQLLDMSKGGNEVATSAAQVRFAAHQIVEGGVKRMNQTELNALTTSLGDYGRQFQAWLDKGFDGKMPEATNNEMATILDAEEANLNATHIRNTDIIQNRYSAISKGGIPPAPTRAPVSNAVAKPDWATHTVRGSDGRMHWTDASASRDGGIAQ